MAINVAVEIVELERENNVGPLGVIGVGDSSASSSGLLGSV